MKKQGSTVDRDVQKMGRFARMCLAFTLGVLMLWLPSYLQTDINAIIIAKGATMFFGLLFLLHGLFRLWDVVTGKPLLSKEDIEEIMKGEAQ